MLIEKLLIERMPDRYSLLCLVYGLASSEPPSQILKEKGGTLMGYYDSEAMSRIKHFVFECVEYYNATHPMDNIEFEGFLEEFGELQNHFFAKTLRQTQLPT